MSHNHTITGALIQSAQRYPENGFTFQASDGSETFASFPYLIRETRRRAAALQARGVVKGDRVAIVLYEPADFVLTFLAIMWCGATPVPLYPANPFGRQDQYYERTTGILANAKPRAMIIADLFMQFPVAKDIAASGTAGDIIPVTETIGPEGAEPRDVVLGPDDIAFLQYTSGSTSLPRGVIVTYEALMANIAAFMDHGLVMDPNHDRGASWLPLYHDMGLVGFVLGPIVTGVSVILLPTLRFAKKAGVWLDAIHRHRSTVSFAPNFAYALAARRVKPEQAQSWDLSCVKTFGCGAEVINPVTARQFNKLFCTHSKLSKAAFTPAYGLAEATLAVTMKRLGTEFSTIEVDAEHFESTGEAVRAQAADKVVEHVSCGAVLPGCELQILDQDGQPVPDRSEGEIWIRGASVTPGYYGLEGKPEGLSTSSREGWLETGDRGYMLDGELVISGRTKDLIIINGRNLHPEQIEWVISEIPGVRRGNVAVFSCLGEGTEQLVVAAETHSEDHATLAKQVQELVQSSFATPAREVILLPPGSLPKTPSGKLQRHKVRASYIAGDLVPQA